MSGDQRVAAANAAGPLQPGRRPHPEGQFVTGEYRRARLSVVIALLLLAGTAVYLVAQERQQTWASARESVLNLALGLETSITGLLEQSTGSLRHISTDLSSRPGARPNPEREIAVLREGARLDSVSSFLGLRNSDG